MSAAFSSEHLAPKGDANAAFNIGRLGAEVVRVSGGGSLSVLPSGSIGGPYAGKEPTQCAS